MDIMLALPEKISREPHPKQGFREWSRTLYSARGVTIRTSAATCACGISGGRSRTLRSARVVRVCVCPYWA